MSPPHPGRPIEPKTTNRSHARQPDRRDHRGLLRRRRTAHAFENAFDNDANFPCPGTIIGQNIEVLTVSTKNNRRELIATCQHGGHRYEVALLDITLDADPTTSRLLAAYRRWVGD